MKFSAQPKHVEGDQLDFVSAELELGTSVSGASSQQLTNTKDPIVKQFTIAVEAIELTLARHVCP